MKSWKSLKLLAVASACALVCLGSMLGVGNVVAFQSPKSPDSEGWNKVEDAIRKGLPKTAIEQLGPIIDAAIENKRYAEAVKGIAKRVVLETQIEGRLPEEGVRRMEAEIEKSS
ncbi:MAG: hypothetical protein MUD03_17455, partial [Pirellula sp.]|nr:hypothetical protein [Pirellula sp.]